jgi:hypothetical protein
VKLSEAAPRCRPKKTTGVVYPRSAGIGIHKQGMTVCLIVDRQDGSRPQVGDPDREGIGQLCAWLKQCQVTDLGRESTGVYGKPVWNAFRGENGVGTFLIRNPCGSRGAL